MSERPRLAPHVAAPATERDGWGAFPTATTDQAPDVSGKTEQIRQLRTRLTPTERLITGIHTGYGAVPVERWTGEAAAGWTLTGYTINIESGRPLGSLLYASDRDGRTVRVGVRWSDAEEQLDAMALHATAPRVADNAPKQELLDLERDARGRVGALLAGLTEIGSFVASGEAEAGLLEAAGLEPNPEEPAHGA